MRSYTPIAYTTVRDPIHTVPRANITWLSRCEAERVEARASPPQRGPQAPAALLSRRTSGQSSATQQSLAPAADALPARLAASAATAAVAAKPTTAAATAEAAF